MKIYLKIFSTSCFVVQVIAHLSKAKRLGLRNILALRGDPPNGEEWKHTDDNLR